MSHDVQQRKHVGYRVRVGAVYVWTFHMAVRGGSLGPKPSDIRHWRAAFAREKELAILFPPTEDGRDAARAVKVMLDEGKIVRVMRRPS